MRYEHYEIPAKPYNHMQLPSLICWVIWLERNISIFECGTPSISATTFKALGIYNTWNAAHTNKPTPQHTLKVPIFEDTNIGWFDGAALSDVSQSEARGAIKTKKKHLLQTVACAPIPGQKFWVPGPHYTWPPDFI